MDKSVGFTFLHIATLFVSLSLMSIGGGNTVIPEMHLKSVQDYQWMTDKQFADIFAISQAAPGPSILIVSLVGYKAGLTCGATFGPVWAQVLGVAGGVLATLAMMIPAAVMVFMVARVWEKGKDAAIRHAIEKGFAPLTVGLVLASGVVMTQAADHDWRAYILTGLCTAIFIFTKVNPLIVVAAAGFLGWLNLV